MSKLKYRFKAPPYVTPYVRTRSLGIEPCRVRDGREVKAGAAIIRLKFYNEATRNWAIEAAEIIVQHLNDGHLWAGPKCINVTRPIAVKSYFHD